MLLWPRAWQELSCWQRGHWNKLPPRLSPMQTELVDSRPTGDYSLTGLWMVSCRSRPLQGTQHEQVRSSWFQGLYNLSGSTRCHHMAHKKMVGNGCQSCLVGGARWVQRAGVVPRVYNLLQTRASNSVAMKYGFKAQSQVRMGMAHWLGFQPLLDVQLKL